MHGPKTTHRPIVMIGYGGHGLTVAATARASGVELAGYCEVSERGDADPFALSFLGPERDYYAQHREEPFFVAVGDNHRRALIADQLLDDTAAEPGPPIVHPRAVVAPGTNLASLSLICAGVVLQPLVNIGRGAVVNTGARVDHECAVGEFAHVGPGAILAGGVTVGRHTLVGAGAVVLPGVRLGEDCTLGAGAVLTRDLPSGATWRGNPARP